MEKPKQQTVVMELSSPVEKNHTNGRMIVEVPGNGWDHKYFCDVRLLKFWHGSMGMGLGAEKKKSRQGIWYLARTICNLVLYHAAYTSSLRYHTRVSLRQPYRHIVKHPSRLPDLPIQIIILSGMKFEIRYVECLISVICCNLPTKRLLHFGLRSEMA